MDLDVPDVHDDRLLRDALQTYFDAYHFKDGGYADRWFRIKFGPFLVPLPNIPARVRAVKVHDIHHVLTGYRADWKGEVEIAGWELAGGCGRYWVAWLLNAATFSIGLVLYPRALFRAVGHGRRMRMNFYGSDVSYEALLGMRVGALRARIAGVGPV
ncbi:MAG TPA: hypothetical protein VHL57_04760 [Flavobacteriales bacterium]|nr:hypothetical protein [Flavobacteriales bacterium]